LKHTKVNSCHIINCFRAMPLYTVLTWSVLSTSEHKSLNELIFADFLQFDSPSVGDVVRLLIHSDYFHQAEFLF